MSGYKYGSNGRRADRFEAKTLLQQTPTSITNISSRMSSLQRIAQQAYVCLQCRTRLAAINTATQRRFESLAKKAQRRHFSARPARLQQPTSADETHLEDHAYFETLAGDPYQDHDDIKLPIDCKVAKTPYVFKRAHLYSKDDLGVTTLGKPAEVLRVRDLPDRHKASKWWLSPDPNDKRLRSTEPVTASDIFKRVNSERGLVSAPRVAQNIEQLKQDWSSSLDDQSLGPTESECHQLSEQLYHGFTTKQLTAYLGELRIPRYRYGEVLDLNGHFVSTSFTRSNWRPGTTPFPGDAAQQLRSMVKDGKEQYIAPVSSASTLRAESKRSGDPFKHVQVNTIMQQCWNIRPREELDSIGEVDIIIPEAHLELLSSHKRNILQQLAAEYEAKIDFSKPERTIRLTANQAICTSSLKLLLMVLDDIVCHKMDVKEDDNPGSGAAGSQSLPDDDALQELERLSCTVIRRPKHKHAAFPEPHKVGQCLREVYAAAKASKLLIYSMRTDEDSLDYALKLIHQSRRPNRSGATTAVYGGRPLTCGKPSLVPVVRTAGLSMTEQGTDWNRVTTTTGKQKTRARAAFHASEGLKRIREQLESSFAAPKVKENKPSHPHWHMDLSQESSVLLGRILYPAKTMSSIKRERYFLEALDKRHAFDTDIPSLRKALDLHVAEASSLQELRVRLNATSNHNMEQLLNHELPDLEIRFSIVEASCKVYPRSVRLILKNRQADLLLPHETTDMRFTRQMYAEATSNIDPDILNFIEKSNLCDYAAQKYETPDRITIKLPNLHLSRMMNSDVFIKAEKSNNGEESQETEEPSVVGDSGGDIPVNYSLAEIEHHHILRSRPYWNRHHRTLNFSLSIIDAGPIGGRRQEVRFFDERDFESTPALLPRKDENQEVEEPIVHSLYDSAHKLIRNLDGPDFDRSQSVSSTKKSRRPVVRQILSDVPMGTVEEHRISTYKDTLPYRIRKTIAGDDPNFEVWEHPASQSMLTPKEGE
ncbi:MAG: hypothetical protein Q9169_003941 [Polycauliona sp. 2 TL-2023]